MICSSTPFITGRPFTMFFNDGVYSEGAVGIAISGVSHSFHVDFPANLQPITPKLTITRCVSYTTYTINPSSSSRLHSHSCEGNLINSLDNLNPTRMLLKAIEAADIRNTKEEDFYLTLVQDGNVRVALSSINSMLIFSPRRSTFSVSLPGTQAGVQYPSSRMRRHLKGLRCRYGVDRFPISY